VKKVSMFLLIAALISPALFAAPSDEDVAESFQAVFAVYGAVFMTSMMGGTVSNVTMDFDMESGASFMEFDNLETAPLFAGLGAALEGSSDMPNPPFSHISGTFTTTAESDMDMNVKLTGGPVKQLSMTVKGEELVSLDADGSSYLHLEAVLGTE